jgi:hypothetical protein
LEGLKQLWQNSLSFRRVATVSAFVLAALSVYLGSHIPRAVSLPLNDLNARSMARILDEQIIIEKPDMTNSDLVLSYVGSKNEVADIWLEKATLDEQSQHLLFPGSTAAAPGRISYTTGSVPDTAEVYDCRTTIEVRLKKGSTLDELRLYQNDATAGAQRFRQVVLDPATSTMAVEVHTDPPPGATEQSACHKLLTIGDKPPIDLPPIPVFMLVQSGKIDLHFNPGNPSLPIWTGRDQTFEAVSLGGSTLRGSGLKVVSTQAHIPARLHVKASPSGGNITFGHMRLGSDMLKIDIGRDGERAVVSANDSSLYNYDLVDEIKNNPIVSFAFAVVLGPAVWKWVRRNCFAKTGS